MILTIFILIDYGAVFEFRKLKLKSIETSIEESGAIIHIFLITETRFIELKEDLKTRMKELLQDSGKVSEYASYATTREKAAKAMKKKEAIYLAKLLEERF
jgi:hypothetical protein